jgi:hypothetical protein
MEDLTGKMMGKWLVLGRDYESDKNGAGGRCFQSSQSHAYMM